MKRRAGCLAAALAGAAAAVSAACTGTSTTASADAGASDASTSFDAANADGGAVDGSIAGANGGLGIIVDVDHTTKKTRASASFVPAGAPLDVAGGATAAGCEVSAIGPCTVLVCPLSAAGDAGAGDEDAGAKDPSAGTLTITGAPSMLTLVADAATGLYDGALADGVVADGATVGASANGAEIPSFSGVAVEAPSVLTLSDAPSVIDYAKDLTLAWTGGASGAMRFDVVASTDTKLGSATCKFAAADASGTIPSAALAKLPSCSDPNASCTYRVGSEAKSPPATAGDYSIALGVYRALARSTFTNP